MKQGLIKLRIIAAIAALVVGILLVVSPAGRLLDQVAYDSNFALRGAVENSDNVVLIAIDEASFQELGMNWPWPRGLHAQLIDSLFAAGAKAVVLDLILADPGAAAEDQSLATALKNAGATVLATDEETRQAEGFTRVINVRPLTKFLAANVVLGSAALPIDADGFVRRFGDSNRVGEASLGMAAAHAFAPDRSNLIAPSKHGINFSGPAGYLPQYSYYQALDAQRFLPPKTLQGKLVFVGLVTQSEVLDQTSSRDAYPTPFTRWGASYMNGVEIHAQAAQSILRGNEITLMATSQAILLGFILAVLTVLITFRYSPVKTLIPLLALTAMAVIFAFWVFVHHHVYLPWPLILLPSLIVGVVSPVVHYVIAWQERNFIHKAFSSYLAAPVVQQLMDQPDMLKLGGSRLTGTVLFLDLHGFTSLSENMQPEEVVDMLNKFLGDVSEIAIDENGLIDKFIGDAMMVVWGAPLANPRHANDACRAALKMQAYLATVRAEENSSSDLYARIGIHSGEFVAGNVGGERKFDYTVIGDTVNVAARLETANDKFGTEILISEATLAAIQGQEFNTRALDYIQLKGREEAVMVFELIDDEIAS